MAYRSSESICCFDDMNRWTKRIIFAESCSHLKGVPSVKIQEPECRACHCSVWEFRFMSAIGRVAHCYLVTLKKAYQKTLQWTKDGQCPVKALLNFLLWFQSQMWSQTTFQFSVLSILALSGSEARGNLVFIVPLPSFNAIHVPMHIKNTSFALTLQID